MDKKHEVKLALLVVTSTILMTVKAQDKTYNANTSQREYVKYLNCTLNVLTPNNTDNAENENNETNLAASSAPSG